MDNTPKRPQLRGMFNKRDNDPKQEQENRIEGLKSSIIAVYGDALDKVGFSITEKANRSAQTRLDKTLKSIDKMESREELMYRKQKYNMQTSLDRLQQKKIINKRECLLKKKSSSLDDLDDIMTVRDRRLHPGIRSSSIDGPPHIVLQDAPHKSMAMSHQALTPHINVSNHDETSITEMANQHSSSRPIRPVSSFPSTFRQSPFYAYSAGKQRNKSLTTKMILN